ncbi:MAG: J domain-containing protein [Anaerolineae bacterium]|nr:J domain-containing protein [Anaerolineae bacterium]
MGDAKRTRRLTYNPQQDYYDILGVNTSSSREEIQQNYRQKAKQLHPDLNPERKEWATEQFQRLNEAYDVLSDTSLRHTYDELRWPHRRPQPSKNPSPSARAWTTEDRWWEQQKRTSHVYTAAKVPAGAWLEKTHFAFLRPAYVMLVDLFNSPYRYVLNLLALAIIGVLVFQMLILGGVVQLPENEVASTTSERGNVSDVTSGIVPTEIPPTAVPTVFSTTRVALKSCAPDILVTVRSLELVGRVLQIKADYKIANGETITDARSISLNRVTILNDTLAELIQGTQIQGSDIDFILTYDPALDDRFPLLDDIVISSNTSYGKNMLDGVYLLHWTPILSSGSPHFACDVLVNIVVAE